MAGLPAVHDVYGRELPFVEVYFKHAAHLAGVSAIQRAVRVSNSFAVMG